MYNVHLNGVWWESSLKVKTTQKVYNIIDSQWPGDGIYKFETTSIQVYTSTIIHLRRVEYYKIVAERRQAQGDGIYTLKTTAI